MRNQQSQQQVNQEAQTLRDILWDGKLMYMGIFLFVFMIVVGNL